MESTLTKRIWHKGPPPHAALVARLRALFVYDPGTGVLKWAVQRAARAPAGAVAGTPHGKGYLRVMVDGKNLYVHRVVWAIVHGTFPEQIDHKNTNRSDNRIDNLRAATNSQNGHNKKTPRATNTGVPNVYFDKRYGTYRACIHAGGPIRLGSFSSLDEAAAAVRAARKVHQPYHVARQPEWSRFERQRRDIHHTAS